MKNSEIEVGQIITIDPRQTAQYEVLAIDTLSDDMVYADPIGTGKPAQWFFTTHAKIVAEQEDATE